MKGAVFIRLYSIRWLEWTVLLLWGALGGVGVFYIPILRSIFESFGSELPLSTAILLRCRPLFALIFGAAVLAAAYLRLKPQPLAGRGRTLLWLGLLAALLTVLGMLHAVFAPMFMGTLSDPLPK